MHKLARAYTPQERAHDAYLLYERFRPDIPAGKKGWGAKGDLDLRVIGRLAKEKYRRSIHRMVKHFPSNPQSFKRA
jgi:hypothetical protein